LEKAGLLFRNGRVWKGKIPVGHWFDIVWSFGLSVEWGVGYWEVFNWALQLGGKSQQNWPFIEKRGAIVKKGPFFQI
jgi:hypothetical protein